MELIVYIVLLLLGLKWNEILFIQLQYFINIHAFIYVIKYKRWVSEKNLSYKPTV